MHFLPGVFFCISAPVGAVSALNRLNLCVNSNRNLLLLRWRYSPEWALASFTIRLQASRSLALSLHSFIPIFIRSVDTSSSHLIFGLPLRLVAYSFPYNIFFFSNCGVLHSFYVTKPSSAIYIIFPYCSMVWTFHVPNVKSVVLCRRRVFIMLRGLL